MTEDTTDKRRPPYTDLLMSLNRKVHTYTTATCFTSILQLPVSRVNTVYDIYVQYLQKQHIIKWTL